MCFQCAQRTALKFSVCRGTHQRLVYGGDSEKSSDRTINHSGRASLRGEKKKINLQNGKKKNQYGWHFRVRTRIGMEGMVRHVELIANVETERVGVCARVRQSRRRSEFSGDSIRKRANFLIPHSWPGSWARYQLRRFDTHTHTHRRHSPPPRQVSTHFAFHLFYAMFGQA